jgi:hypothetical protein
MKMTVASATRAAAKAKVSVGWTHFSGFVASPWQQHSMVERVGDCCGLWCWAGRWQHVSCTETASACWYSTKASHHPGGKAGTRLVTATMSWTKTDFMAKSFYAR